MLMLSCYIWMTRTYINQHLSWKYKFFNASAGLGAVELYVSISIQTKATYQYLYDKLS